MAVMVMMAQGIHDFQRHNVVESEVNYLSVVVIDNAC